MIYCQHYACRCARANELAMMADRSGRPELLLEALQVHEQKVRCRQVYATPQERADAIVANFNWRVRTAFAKLRDDLALHWRDVAGLERAGAVRWVNNRRRPDPEILAAFERMCSRRMQNSK